MVFVGIDPGISGAIAVLNTETKAVDFIDTPTIKVKVGKSIKQQQDPYAIVSILKALKDGKDIFAVIEKVNAMPAKGKNGESIPLGATSLFNFGMGFGEWLGILAAVEIPHQQVAPRTWKTAMMPDASKEKGASIVIAKQLFPQAADGLTRKKDHGRADALLMAAWARRTSTIR